MKDFNAKQVRKIRDHAVQELRSRHGVEPNIRLFDAITAAKRSYDESAAINWLVDQFGPRAVAR